MTDSPAPVPPSAAPGGDVCEFCAHGREHHGADGVRCRGAFATSGMCLCRKFVAPERLHELDEGWATPTEVGATCTCGWTGTWPASDDDENRPTILALFTAHLAETVPLIPSDPYDDALAAARAGCCAARRKPCEYHTAWADGYEAAQRDLEASRD